MCSNVDVDVDPGMCSNVDVDPGMLYGAVCTAVYADATTPSYCRVRGCNDTLPARELLGYKPVH